MHRQTVQLCHRTRRAFSLLEVLVAIALLVALLGSLFGFYLNLLDARERLQRRTVQHRAADLLIERLERDLMTCLVGEAHLGSGVVGERQVISLLSRSVAAHRAAEGRRDAALFGDLQRIAYAFDDRRDQLVMRAAAAPGAADPGLSSAVLAENIGFVRFRYLDPSGWQDRFDALRARQLPRAVEVSIWFDDPRPPSDTFGSEAATDADADRLPLPDEESVNFDEDAFIDRSEQMLQDLPLPDRYRIIPVPDSAGGAGAVEVETGGGAGDFDGDSAVGSGGDA